MTANKSSKARAGDGKAAQDIPDRSVTSGTEKGRAGAGFLSLFTPVLSVWNLRSVCTVLLFVAHESFT